MARTEPISAEDLRQVSSGRWLVPILAIMSAEDGSRFSALLRALKLSRSVLSNHLDLLEQFGWIARNPGHGHPLRPEYLLTASGRIVAAWCERAMEQRNQMGLEPQNLGRWSLPLMFELRGNVRRFSELQRNLRPVTPRALSLAIDQMLDIRFVDRKPVNLVPFYGLTARGEDFAAIFEGAR